LKELLGVDRGQALSVKGEVITFVDGVPLVLRNREGVLVVILGNRHVPALRVRDRGADGGLTVVGVALHRSRFGRVVLPNNASLVNTAHMSGDSNDVADDKEYRTDRKKSHEASDNEVDLVFLPGLSQTSGEGRLRLGLSGVHGVLLGVVLRGRPFLPGDTYST